MMRIIGMLTQPKRLIFNVSDPGDIEAGICGFTDIVEILIESGNPGGEPGEFEEYILECLRDWYTGADVVEDTD